MQTSEGVFESETLIVGCPEIQTSTNTGFNMKIQKFNKNTAANIQTSCTLTDTPKGAAYVWVFVNGAYINEVTISGKNILFTLNYEITVTDEITIHYAI